MTKCPLSGRGQGQVTHSKISHPEISLKRLKLQSSNFVCLQAISNPSDGWSSLKGVWPGSRAPF